MKQNTFRWERIFRNPAFPGFMVLLALITINAILQPGFFSYNNLKYSLMDFSPLIFLSMAQAIVLLSGSVDFSVGGVVALFTVVCASLMQDPVFIIIAVLAVGFAIALLAGLINGTLVGILKLPPVITTFATFYIFWGIARLIMPVEGGYVPRFFYKMYRSQIMEYIPIVVIVLTIGLGLWYLVSKTILYRHIYAVGSNEDAAFASSIKVNRVRIAAHILAGFFVGMAGYCLLMTTASGIHTQMQTYTLNSVAAAVIGGVSLSGGRGSVLGAVIGALILGLLGNVIFFMNIPSFYQDFTRGMIIILAIGMGQLPRLWQQRHSI
jgi:ribose transport system permease protein